MRDLERHLAEFAPDMPEAEAEAAIAAAAARTPDPWARAETVWCRDEREGRECSHRSLPWSDPASDPLGDMAIHRRAAELQHQGPDEYPFGYWLHLAAVERSEGRA